MAVKSLAPRFEALLSADLALVDVSDLLPARRAPRREVSRIRKVYVRHSGVPGRVGLAGVEVHTALALRAYRGPCAPGHYWLAADPLIDLDWPTAVLRTAPDDWRAPHTGGRADTHGLGIVVQGDLDVAPMSTFQRLALAALLSRLRKTYAQQLDADWLCWERGLSATGRQRSSGSHLVGWLQAYAAEMAQELAAAI